MALFNLFGKRSKGVAPELHALPTVQFDSSRVTEAVRIDLKANIGRLPDIDDGHFEVVYDAALRSISVGRDLHVLYKALISIDGMTKRRASAIALELNNKATAFMEADRRTALGLKEAIWMYSFAPCIANPKSPSESDLRQDAAHKAANGNIYNIAEGMFLDGKWTSPGREPGCRCSSRVKIKGLT